MSRTVTMSLALLVACGSGPGSETPAGADADPDAGTSSGPLDLTVDLAPPENGYQAVTPAFEVPPYSEIQVCSIVTLQPKDGESLVWFQELESLSSDDTHHMNIFIGDFSFLDAFVAEGASQNALGTDALQLPCEDLELMGQSFPVFPSQRDNQRITLPKGVAAPMPLPLVAVASHHYVNPTAEPILINAALNMEVVQPEEVETTANLLFNDIGGFEIEPGTRQSVSRTCVAERDVSVALVSTHTHEWTECTTLNRFDGETAEVEDAPFYVNQNWDQPPIHHFEEGSFELAAGDGIHWSCHYENGTDRAIVNDGSATGEMCVFAAVTWPAVHTVEEITDIVEERDLAQMLQLLGDVMGPCDTVVEDVAGPWATGASPLEGAGVCADMDQTESNTLY